MLFYIFAIELLFISLTCGAVNLFKYRLFITMAVANQLMRERGSSRAPLPMDV